MSEPLVTIGIATFQKEPLLRATLEHALAQTHENLEVLVADNASTDGTLAIAREYAARDARVRVVEHQRNLGSRRNFNLLFELAHGEFFVWGRGHDLWHPEFVATGVELLTRDPELVLVHSAAREIDGVDRDLGPVAEDLDTRGLDLPQRLQACWRRLLGPATLGVIRRSAMDRTNLYQELAGCDLVFLLELAAQGTFAFVDRPLLRLRRVRSEGSEAESVQRTWRQMNPHRPRRESPDLHVLEFLAAHARVLRELDVAPGVRDDLTADLVGCFAEKFAGSFTRAFDHLADRVDAAAAPDGAPAERLDAVTALHWLAQLQLGLLCQPGHERALATRNALLHLAIDLIAEPTLP